MQGEKSHILMDSDENKGIRSLNLIELNQREVEIRDDFVSSINKTEAFSTHGRLFSI